MKGKIPGRVPGILPLVRHRDDVAVIHVVPMIVAWGAALRLERIGTALGEPLVDIIVVELLGPQHAGQRLAHHVGCIGIERRRDDRGIELVRFLPARLHRGVEVAPERSWFCRSRCTRRHGAQPQPQRPRLPGPYANTPVSSNSYSNSCRLRRRLVATRSSYG